MENVNIYNCRREKTGKIKERHSLENGEYRISAHIWIIDKDNRLLIQKRALTEKKFPGKWSQTGGGVIAEETSLETVKRETKEELNVKVNNDEIYYIGSYTRIRDIVDVWLVEKNIDFNEIKLQEEEVAEVKFVTFEEFDKMIEEGMVVPSINPSYMLVKNYFCNFKDNKDAIKF